MKKVYNPVVLFASSLILFVSHWSHAEWFLSNLEMNTVSVMESADDQPSVLIPQGQFEIRSEIHDSRHPFFSGALRVELQAEVDQTRTEGNFVKVVIDGWSLSNVLGGYPNGIHPKYPRSLVKMTREFAGIEDVKCEKKDERYHEFLFHYKIEEQDGVLSYDLKDMRRNLLVLIGTLLEHLYVPGDLVEILTQVLKLEPTEISEQEWDLFQKKLRRVKKRYKSFREKRKQEAEKQEEVLMGLLSEFSDFEIQDNSENSLNSSPPGMTLESEPHKKTRKKRAPLEPVPQNPQL